MRTWGQFYYLALTPLSSPCGDKLRRAGWRVAGTESVLIKGSEATRLPAVSFIDW